MNRLSCRLLICVGMLALGGCAGKGERIDIAIPGGIPAGGTVSLATPGPRIAVLPFEDQRPNQTHLGTRSHLWGGVSYFDLPSGTVAKAAAQALVDYLNRRGWKASLARTPGSDGADITIAGTIQSLSVDAKSGFMHTDLTATNALAFQIMNHTDESIVRERVSGTGSDRVFWFDEEDAQALITDLFETNFKKFLGDLKIEGRTMRLN
ncbi:MAG: hypothetical protein ABL965_03420 [Nitrospira sp.]|nr:MAG: hypothetical protein CAF44_006575 [Nitrospira sp. CG24D]TKB83195.1 MAG: hypothetical protein E8D44_08070 [Nitrospira sp.]